MIPAISISQGRGLSRATRRKMVLLAAMAAGSLLASAPVQADVYWTGGGTWKSTGDWNTAADGVSGTYRLPVAGDMAIFSATNVLYDQVTTLDVAFSVLGLTFQNTGYAVTIGPDYPSVNTLTLGTSGITMNSGAGAVTIGDALALSGGQTWTNNSSNFLAIGGNITTGSNNLTLAGTGNTFLSGNIATNGNTLTFNGTGSTTLGGNITMASGANLTFAGGGSATINGNIVTTGAGSLSFNGTGSTTVNGVIGSGSGTVYINSGTVTFGNANTYTGPTQVGATLIVANASGSATGSGNVIVTSTGTLEGSGIITGAVSVSGGGHLDPHPNSTATGTGQLTLTTSTSTTLTLQTGSIVDFNIGATSDLVQVNGKLSIPAALSAVTLKVNALDGFGAGTYELFGYTSLVNTFNHNYIAITSSTPAIPLAPSFTYTTSNDAVNKRINLVVTVKPTLTWSATNGTTWDTSSLNWNGGATAFTAGSPVEFDDNVPADPSNTVTLSNLYTLNPLSVVVNTNTTYTFTGNGFLQDVTSTVPMTLIKNGTGKLTIGSNLANNFTGGTTINGGTIAISTANSLGGGGLTINAGTLEATTNITSTRNITLGVPTAAIAVDSGQNLTSSGIISGTGNLNVTGAGTLALTGNNTFTGQTLIQSGTVSVTSFAAVGTAQPGHERQPGGDRRRHPGLHGHRQRVERSAHRFRRGRRQHRRHDCRRHPHAHRTGERRHAEEPGPRHAGGFRHQHLCRRDERRQRHPPGRQRRDPWLRPGYSLGRRHPSFQQQHPGNRTGPAHGGLGLCVQQQLGQPQRRSCEHRSRDPRDLAV